MEVHVVDANQCMNRVFVLRNLSLQRALTRFLGESSMVFICRWVQSHSVNQSLDIRLVGGQVATEVTMLNAICDRGNGSVSSLSVDTVLPSRNRVVS